MTRKKHLQELHDEIFQVSEVLNCVCRTPDAIRISKPLWINTPLYTVAPSAWLLPPLYITLIEHYFKLKLNFELNRGPQCEMGPGENPCSGYFKAIREEGSFYQTLLWV